jgi:hypothetical protein
MENVADGKFSCGGCGKSYKWKPELAGKKAKCKCGHVMTVPKEISGGDELDDLYALAEDASAKKNEAVVAGIRCPSCGGGMQVGEALCVSCGFNIKTGRRAAVQAEPVGALAMAGAGGAAPAILAYGGGKVAAKTAGKDEVGDNNLIEYYIPAGLIAFGFLIAILRAMKFSTSPMFFGAAMGYVMVSTVVDLTLMLIACFVAAKVLDASFGSPGSAILKLAAISLFPEAVAASIEFFMPAAYGWIVGWAVALIFYYCLFSYLFDLDGGEVLMLVFIIRGIKFFLGGLIILALFTLFTGKGSSALNSFASAGASSNAHVTDADKEMDETLKNTKQCVEADAWLKESGGRIFGKEGHGDCLTITKEVYDAGATKVTAIKDGSIAEEVVISLPKKKEARQRIFAWHEKNKDKYQWDDEVDEGQRYLVLSFDSMSSAGERAAAQQKFKAMQKSPNAPKSSPSNSDE